MGRDKLLIDAIAVMLSAPAVKRGKALDAPKLAFGPGELHQMMKSRVGHIIVCEPVEARLFGMLGKRLQQISGLEREDMERITSWVDAGGLHWWTQGRPTFASVVNNVGKWIASARDWDKRGRQAIKAGPMGSELPVDVSGAFR